MRRVGADGRVAARRQDGRGASGRATRRSTCRRARSWGRSCAPATAAASSCAPGSRTAFGAIALRLGERQAQTVVPAGPAGLLAPARRRSPRSSPARSSSSTPCSAGRCSQSALFALAIAVGLTPQLLPAIVTVSLATGARRLAQRQVIVKRLVCIEDLGNVEVLFTDKTGTLTEGHISFTEVARPRAARPTRRVSALGRGVQRRETGNELDRALCAPAPGRGRGSAALARRSTGCRSTTSASSASVLVDAPQGGRLLIAKGAPGGGARALRERSRRGAGDARPALRRRRARRSRSRAAPVTIERIGPETTSSDLSLAGFLCFTDPAKADVRRLARPVGRARHHGEDRHRRQRPGGGAPLRRSRPRPGHGRDGRGARGDGRRRARRGCCRRRRSSPASRPSRSRASSMRSAASARTSASSATASTTRSRCTTPTSASPSTPRPTSRRTRPTSSCSTRTSASSPTASSRADASSPTRSSTC